MSCESLNRYEVVKGSAYLLVSGDAFVHVPHKNLRPLLPVGLNPLPLVSLEHTFPARVHFEGGEALHLLDLDPGNDLRDLLLLQRRAFLILLLYGWFRILPDDVRLPPFSRHGFRRDDRQAVRVEGNDGGFGSKR